MVRFNTNLNGGTFLRLHRCVFGEVPMPDTQHLIDTLRSTSAGLAAIRKAIADGGHLEPMRDFDTRIALAQEEAKRCLAVAVLCQRLQGLSSA
jgi:hypothetical protein